jgi:hypothetical protein
VLRCLADQDPFARRRGVAPAGGCKAARPVPWVSQIDASGTVWDPWIFDSRRAEAMVRLDLCQVCGLRRGATVYVLGAAPGGGTPSDQRGAMIGGALCSLRCARLTATACPHFSTRRPIEIHAVPKAAQRIRLSDAEFDIDEVYDLSGLVPLVVLDDSEPAAADLVTERRSGGPR